MKLYISFINFVLFLGLFSYDATVLFRKNADKIKCETSLKPNSSAEPPLIVIDLDKPANERWTTLVVMKNSSLHKLNDFIKSFMGSKMLHYFSYFLESPLSKTFSKEHVAEMKNIAEVAKIPFGNVLLLNIFYEVSAMCTSIVIKNPYNENIVHARNLDFGFPFGYNTTQHKMILQSILSELIVDTIWMKNGKKSTRMTTIVGYIGALTGMSYNGKFAFSVNQRYTMIPSIYLVLKNLLSKTGEYNGILARNLLLSGVSYKDAVKEFNETKLLSGAYFTVSSTSEAALISRDHNKIQYYKKISNKKGNNWYVFETNYDKNKPAPFFDDRRRYIQACIDSTDWEKIQSIEALENRIYNILSTKPVLNKQTIHTTLMNIETKSYNTYMRECPDPCPIL